MNIGKSRQRGVLSLATGALLSLFGVLAAATGCSSGGEDAGSGGAERLGHSVQALTCGRTVCNTDDCTAYTCGKLEDCQLVSTKKDGEACTNIAKESGICISGSCCTGCYEKPKLGGVICHNQVDANFCGAPGDACTKCNSGDVCITDLCKEGKCVQDPIPDGDACRDNSGSCYKGKCCSGCIDGNGNCAAGTSDPHACGTSVPGKLDKCANCDDGVCDGADSCANGLCVEGQSLDCDDKNPCTVDSCDAVKGCVHVAEEAGTSCDDGNVCNGVSKCEGTLCKPGTALDCDDNNICTTDSCDMLTGCKHVNNTVACSDNNLCTLVDKCSAGKCVGSGAPNCDDNNPCTTDSCDPAKQCQHVALADDSDCNDGNSCTTVDKCVGGKCLGSGGPNCDDNDPCTKNTCSVATQMCSNPDENNGTPCTFDKCHVNSTCQSGSCSAGTEVDCDDNNPCTKDSCDASLGCVHEDDDGVQCSDNDLCTTGDACDGGECVGTEVTCAPLDDCHVAGTCNPQTGQCDDPRADDDTECDAGTGTCLSGKCKPNPSGGAGGETGAGGEPAASGGAGPGAGGEGTTAAAGDGNEPVAGGAGEAGQEGGAPGTGASGNEGGDGKRPNRVFVRDPGGCSCGVPASGETGPASALALAGLALGAALWRRRRRAA